MHLANLIHIYTKYIYVKVNVTAPVSNILGKHCSELMLSPQRCRGMIKQLMMMKDFERTSQYEPHHLLSSDNSLAEGQEGCERFWLRQGLCLLAVCSWVLCFYLRFNINILLGLTPPCCQSWSKHSRTRSWMHLSCWIGVISYADKEQ